jgi:hypothetical protein
MDAESQMDGVLPSMEPGYNCEAVFTKVITEWYSIVPTKQIK